MRTQQKVTQAFEHKDYRHFYQIMPQESPWLAGMPKSTLTRN